MSFQIPSNICSSSGGGSTQPTQRLKALVGPRVLMTRRKLPVTSSLPAKKAIGSNAFKHPLAPQPPLVPRVNILSDAATTTSTRSPSGGGVKRKRLFSKELRCMLYGFGDKNSYTETVDMVEDLVLQFISDIAIRALKFGANDRISIEDLMYVLRKDPKKYSRLKDLLDMNNELRQARKAFDEIKYIDTP